MSVRKDGVVNCCSREIYIGLIPCTVFIGLRGPDVSALDFLVMSLFVINPPIQESSPTSPGREDEVFRASSMVPVFNLDVQILQTY